MNTVYVIQQPKPNNRGWMPDLSPAAKYGRLEFIYSSDMVMHYNIDKAIEVAKNKLKQFDPDTDYVCYPNTGDPSGIYIVIQILTGWGYESIKYLSWNRKKDDNGDIIPSSGYYSPIEVNTGANNANY